MKKNICITAFILVSLLCVACSSSDGEVENNVALDTPTIMDNGQTESQRSFEGMKVENGYWTKTINNGNESYDMVVPVLSNENSKIYDLEDMANDMDDADKILKLINKGNAPLGTDYAPGTGGFMPMYMESSNDDVKMQSVMMVQGWSSFSDDNQYTIESVDIGCVTFQLYEELYNDIPSVYIRVFGITDDNLNSYMKVISQGGKEHKYVDFNALSEDIKNSNILPDIVVEKNVSESGIYYIDYNEIQKDKSYSQYVYEMTWSYIPDKYSYCINGNG